MQVINRQILFSKGMIMYKRSKVFWNNKSNIRVKIEIDRERERIERGKVIEIMIDI